MSKTVIASYRYRGVVCFARDQKWQIVEHTCERITYGAPHVTPGTLPALAQADLRRRYPGAVYLFVLTVRRSASKLQAAFNRRRAAELDAAAAAKEAGEVAP